MRNLYILLVVLAVCVCTGCMPVLPTDCSQMLFEDGSSITYCEETREGVRNLCRYMRDEHAILVEWDCSTLYG